MPTRRGWVLAAGAVVAGFAGRLLGVRELFATAAAGEAVLLAALAFVWWRPVQFRVERRLWPDRVAAGGTVRVDLQLINRARRRSPAVRLLDGGQALAAGSLAPGAAVRWAYPYTARGRGLVDVGPARIRVTDPLGVAYRSAEAGSSTVLTVHPYIDDIELPPEPPTTGPTAGARQVSASTFAGDEFHALRPYEDGDDLRQVHWPTTARRGDLYIRQDEVPRPRQTVVALDLRDEVHDRVSVERAVSAAASVVVAAGHDDGQVRLVTTGGLDSGIAGGSAHIGPLLDFLAGAHPDDSTGLAALAGTIGLGIEGATLVLITSSAATSADLATTAGFRHTGADVTIVCFEVRGFEVGRNAVAPVAGVLTVGRETDFRGAWTRGVGRDLLMPAVAGSR